MSASWRTTLCGILSIIASAIATIGLPILDADPLTIPNWTAFGAAVAAAVGLFMARDDSVTSEMAGAKSRL